MTRQGSSGSPSDPQRRVSSPDAKSRPRAAGRGKRAGLAALGWFLALFVLGPLYIILINSFKSRKQIFSDQLGLPSSFSWAYYQEAGRKMDFGRALWNSFWEVAVSVLLIVLISSITAWALNRRHTRGSKLLFVLFISMTLIPFQAVMLPLVQYFTKWTIPALGFKMVGTLYGLVFFNIGFGLPLSIFLFHGAVTQVPISMEESATIDGCNRWQLFWRIVFPNLTPMAITVGILNVISYWNDYLLPSMVIQDPKLRTIPLSTFYFFGEFNIQWNLALAGLVMTILPVVLFYLFAQRYIIDSVMTGAVKG
ncbi:carbohydrate ABC transporter permease [Oscillospiraceae bacterium HV4-5-C5C]|nr:carbohydrate ABC transporter permease [Oscillospiraceae bacterium HV4-5-C5C]